jgi:hypothetical protein
MCSHVYTQKEKLLKMIFIDVPKMIGSFYERHDSPIRDPSIIKKKPWADLSLASLDRVCSAAKDLQDDRNEQHDLQLNEQH